MKQYCEDVSTKEKVIKGLEWCLFEEGCNGCPYNHSCDDRYSIAHDALAMLKAQEPRVMTLEEVKAIQPDTDVWMEVVPLHGPIRVRAYTVSGFTPGGGRLCVIGGAHNYPVDTYNKYFRCWTSRPTKEMMEAVKWDV